MLRHGRAGQPGPCGGTGSGAPRELCAAAPRSASAWRQRCSTWRRAALRPVSFRAAPAGPLCRELRVCAAGSGAVCGAGRDGGNRKAASGVASGCRGAVRRGVLQLGVWSGHRRAVAGVSPAKCCAPGGGSVLCCASVRGTSGSSNAIARGARGGTASVSCVKQCSLYV